jgi:hypothetical protein
MGARTSDFIHSARLESTAGSFAQRQLVQLCSCSALQTFAGLTRIFSLHALLVRYGGSTTIARGGCSGAAVRMPVCVSRANIVWFPPCICLRKCARWCPLDRNVRRCYGPSESDKHVLLGVSESTAHPHASLMLQCRPLWQLQARPRCHATSSVPCHKRADLEGRAQTRAQRAP